MISSEFSKEGINIANSVCKYSLKISVCFYDCFKLEDYQNNLAFLEHTLVEKAEMHSGQWWLSGLEWNI